MTLIVVLRAVTARHLPWRGSSFSSRCPSREGKHEETRQWEQTSYVTPRQVPSGKLVPGQTGGRKQQVMQQCLDDITVYHVMGKHSRSKKD